MCLNTAELVIIHANYLVNCSSLLSAVLITDTFMCILTLSHLIILLQLDAKVAELIHEKSELSGRIEEDQDEIEEMMSK